MIFFHSIFEPPNSMKTYFQVPLKTYLWLVWLQEDILDTSEGSARLPWQFPKANRLSCMITGSLHRSGIWQDSFHLGRSAYRSMPRKFLQQVFDSWGDSYIFAGRGDTSYGKFTHIKTVYYGRESLVWQEQYSPSPPIDVWFLENIFWYVHSSNTLWNLSDIVEMY